VTSLPSGLIPAGVQGIVIESPRGKLDSGKCFVDNRVMKNYADEVIGDDGKDRYP
jgi:hypothetical protein